MSLLRASSSLMKSKCVYVVHVHTYVHEYVYFRIANVHFVYCAYVMSWYMMELVVQYVLCCPALAELVAVTVCPFSVFTGISSLFSSGIVARRCVRRCDVMWAYICALDIFYEFTTVPVCHPK